MSKLELKAVPFLEDDPIDPECIERTLRACEGEPFFGEHGSKRYCVLHFPDAAKEEAFEIAVQKKLESKDFNYKGVWFPKWNSLTGFIINEEVDFSFAVFHDGALFNRTTFNKKVTFDHAILNNDAGFPHALFKGKVELIAATFGKEADFRDTTFMGDANFRDCTFTGRVNFSNSVFRQAANFWPAKFISRASFWNASFGHANFRVSDST